MSVSGPSSNQLPGFVTLPPTSTPTGGVGGVADVHNQSPTNQVRGPGSLSEQAAAGEVSYAAAKSDSLDWDALARDASLAANLSVSITAIMTLLIQILAEMKKTSKEAGFAEAQNALETGLAAAAQMEVAAKAKYLSAMVSAGMTMAMGFVQLGMSSHTASMTKSGASESAMQAFNAKASAFQSIAQSLISFVTASLDLEAGLAEAEAQALRSTAEYQQSVAQLQKDFAAQLAEAINKALGTMAKISDVQHELTRAIYGV